MDFLKMLIEDFGPPAPDWRADLAAGRLRADGFEQVHGVAAAGGAVASLLASAGFTAAAAGQERPVGNGIVVSADFGGRPGACPQPRR